jgi:hypothetical protein
MKARSTIKDDAWYQRRVSETTKLQLGSIGRLLGGEIAHDRISAVESMIFSRWQHLLLRKYSAGYPIVELKADWENAQELLSRVWPDDGTQAEPDFLKEWYVNLLWQLSFAIFLDRPREDFELIVGVFDKTNRKDWVIDMLASAKLNSRVVSDSLLFPKPYKTLKSAIEIGDNPKQQNMLRHYLEKEWYPGHKACYWYDNHKSKHDTYFGYWSFETAALVKILGIDDSGFRDCEYYPKDLA